MKQAFIVTEYSNVLLEDYDLSHEEREYLTRTSIIHESRPWERRFYFDELKNGLRIKTESWVGVIELERARIVIQPKFNHGFQSLVDMISFIDELPFYQRRDTSGTVRKTNFLEILILLFLKEVEQVIKVGFMKDYVTEEDYLSNLRGRVDFKTNLQRNYNLPTKVYCYYDELVTNIVENQILLSVLAKISSLNLQANTKRWLNTLRSQFETICVEYAGHDWPKFQYNRLNKHYERAHKIGKYLWENSSLTTFFTKNHFYYSFLIDMNELFEKFVVQLLRKYLPKHYKVLANKRITDAITVDGASYRHIIPDIIIENERTNERKVIDVKYKQYANKRVETDDVFQLAFYAQNQMKSSGSVYESTIIYPKFIDDPVKDDIVVTLNMNSTYPGKLFMKFIQIEDLLSSIRNQEIAKLNDEVGRLVCSL